jgi:hypothetical protein
MGQALILPDAANRGLEAMLDMVAFGVFLMRRRRQRIVFLEAFHTVFIEVRQ